MDILAHIHRPAHERQFMGGDETGRTTPTARQSLERIAGLIEKMQSIMVTSDRKISMDLVSKGRRHSAEISYSLIDPEIGFLFSILIEMQREINALLGKR